MDKFDTSKKWSVYNRIGDLNLSTNCNLNNIIDALQTKGTSSTLKMPFFRSDFPNLVASLSPESTGAKHLLQIDYADRGYVTISDWDIGNNKIFVRTHFGDNYTSWKEL